MNTIILLDLDGPLVDCAGDVLERYGNPRSKQSTFSSWEDLPNFLTSHMRPWDSSPWDRLGKDVDFWRCMTAQPWQQDLLDHCSALAPVTICTKPLPYGECAAGKLEWCLDRDLIPTITRDKLLLASPGHLLIDDSEETVAAFRLSGGRAVLWPMPWNTRGVLEEYGLHRVFDEIEGAIE